MDDQHRQEKMWYPQVMFYKTKFQHDPVLTTLSLWVPLIAILHPRWFLLLELASARLYVIPYDYHLISKTWRRCTQIFEI